MDHNKSLAPSAGPDLEQPDLYINRELSWIAERPGCFAQIAA